MDNAIATILCILSMAMNSLYQGFFVARLPDFFACGGWWGSKAVFACQPHAEEPVHLANFHLQSRLILTSALGSIK